MGSLLFEKKRLFKLYFNLWAKVFRVYCKTFSARSSELHSLCPVEHSMEKSFLKNLVFLHEEVRWNFLEIRRKNSERVVRTALYMPGGKISWENFLRKKNNSFPATRRKFSWFIAKRVFWQELQNRSARVKKIICEKILLKKIEKPAIADNRRKLSALLALKFQHVCQNFYQVSSWTSYEKIVGW